MQQPLQNIVAYIHNYANALQFGACDDIWREKKSIYIVKKIVVTLAEWKKSRTFAALNIQFLD